MVKGNVWLDACRQKDINDLIVILQPCFVDLPKTAPIFSELGDQMFGSLLHKLVHL